MGPNDPFEQVSMTKGFPHYAASSSDEEQQQGAQQTTLSSTSGGPAYPPYKAPDVAFKLSEIPWHKALLTGAFSGAAVGVLSLFTTWTQILQVLLFGLLGMGVAWVVMGVLSGQLDVRGAWRALRRRT